MIIFKLKLPHIFDNFSTPTTKTPKPQNSRPKSPGPNRRSTWIGINQGSMDLLLGPSTWDFRMAAAQVAEEFQMPLVLWSFPESLGMGWVLPTNTMVPWIFFRGKIHRCLGKTFEDDFPFTKVACVSSLGSSWGWQDVFFIDFYDFLSISTSEWAPEV